jgi:hypothetical protein
MKKTTKTLTPADYAERARTMPQDEFNAKVEEALADAAATIWAVQTLLDARRQTAA